MTTDAQKALEILIQQANAKNVIKSLSKKIGDNLELCRNKNQGENNFNFEPHLFEAYKPIVIEDDWGDADTHYRTNDESIKFLEICQFCLTAHHSVQDRKKWKKKLATLRGTATKLGMSALSKENQQ